MLCYPGYYFFFLCKSSKHPRTKFRSSRETSINKRTSVTLRHPRTHIHHEDNFNRAGHCQASLRTRLHIKCLAHWYFACVHTHCLAFCILWRCFTLLPTTTSYPALYWLGRCSARTPCKERQTAVRTTAGKDEGALQAPNLSYTQTSHHWSTQWVLHHWSTPNDNPVGLPKANRLGRKSSRKIPAAARPLSHAGLG
jgi:hypothetical protein